MSNEKWSQVTKPIYLIEVQMVKHALEKTLAKDMTLESVVA